MRISSIWMDISYQGHKWGNRITSSTSYAPAFFMKEQSWCFCLCLCCCCYCHCCYCCCFCCVLLLPLLFFCFFFLSIFLHLLLLLLFLLSLSLEPKYSLLNRSPTRSCHACLSWNNVCTCHPPPPPLPSKRHVSTCYSIMKQSKNNGIMHHLGTMWFYISVFSCGLWSESPRLTACQGWRNSVCPPMIKDAPVAHFV